MPIVEVLDRCFEHHGTEPTIGELERFARANGIPFPRKERGRPYSSYVEEWKADRQRRGLPVPNGPPPKAQRPDYDQDVGAALPGERRMQRHDDLDAVVGWVARYLSELQPGERASQRGYDDWSRQHDGSPWSSDFGRHGGWSAVLALARERPRGGARAPTRTR